MFAAVAANILAASVVLGLVALGAATIVGRSVAEAAGHRLTRRGAATGASRTSKRRRPKESGRKARVESRSGQQ